MQTPHITGKGARSLAGDYLATLRDFASAKGIKTQLLLADSGISLEHMLNPPARIGEISMQQICSNLVAALDKPYEASIEFGRSMAIGHHGVLGIAAQGAQTLLEAAELTAQFFRTRTSFRDIDIVHRSDHVALRLIKTGSGLHSIDEPTRLFFDLSTMINLAHIGEQLLSISGYDFSAQIHVDRPQPADFPHHLLGTSVEIEFNQPHFELCVPLEWMQVPLKTANTELAAAAASKCESELLALDPRDLLSEVRQRILAAQGRTLPTLDELAAQMYMSTSTLQRRLRDQQTTYKALKAELQSVKAKQLLQTSPLTVESIAEQLGYSDASNFSKAFRSWTGETPKAFRQRSGNHNSRPR